MKKRKRNVGKPKKGPTNPFLPPQFQGRNYRVSMVSVSARVEILTDNGGTETDFMAPAAHWYNADWKTTLPQFFANLGLILEEPK